MKNLSCLSKGVVGVLTCLLIAVLGVYVFYILFHAEWLIGDDAFMLRRTAFGIPFPLSESIMPSVGFFRPFDYLHENIVLLFHSGMHNAFEHYIINAVSFVLCSGAMAGVLWMTVKPKDAVEYAIVIFGTILVASRLIGVYINIFGPIFGVYTYHALALFFLCIFLRNDRVWALLLSLWCWTYSMLIYENICIVLGCMGMFPLLFAYRRLTRKQAVYCFSLIGLAFAFVLTYLFVIYLPSRGHNHYDPSHHTGVGMLENAISILKGQKFIWVAALVWLWRQVQLLRKKATYHILYDTLLWTAGASVAGAVLLRLNWSMYYYDAIILSLPAVVFFVMNASGRYGKYAALCLVLAFAALHSYRVPASISNNQKARRTTAFHMNLIAEKAAEGWSVVWYDDEKLGEADEIQKEFKKETSKNYFQYLLKDRNWDYDTEIGDRTVVVYPLQNQTPAFCPKDYERVSFGGISYFILDRNEVQ